MGSINEVDEAMVKMLEERDKALPFEVSRVRGSSYIATQADSDYVAGIEERDKVLPFEVTRVHGNDVPVNRVMNDQPLPAGERSDAQILDEAALARAAAMTASPNLESDHRAEGVIPADLGAQINAAAAAADAPAPKATKKADAAP